MLIILFYQIFPLNVQRFKVANLAEAVRFELKIPFDMPPFQGGGINRYPTPPYFERISQELKKAMHAHRHSFSFIHPDHHLQVLTNPRSQSCLTHRRPDCDPSTLLHALPDRQS